MGSMHADYGASALNCYARPGERFHFAANGIYEGFTVMAWNLTDCGPAHGGFWCIPGSHKSHTVRLRSHPGGAHGVGRIVLRGGDARDSAVARRSRAPDAALQVLLRPLPLQRRTRRGAVE